MNVNLFIFFAYLAFLVFLTTRKSPWLFFILPLAFSFPTARALVGPVPIYLYDCAAVCCLTAIYQLKFWKDQPNVFPWVPIMAGVFILFGTALPMVRYGPSADFIWTVAHHLIAWGMFYVGLAMALPSFRPHSDALVKGMVVSLAWLAVVSLFSWRSPERTAFFNNIFYPDLGELVTSESYAIVWSYRAQGPFLNPTNLALFSLFMAGYIILRNYTVKKYWVYAGLACAGINILASVSRQVLLVAILSAAVYFLLAPLRKSVRNLLLGAGLIIVLFASTGGGDEVSERFGRVTEDGIYEENVSARLIDGPARLYDLFIRKPELILTGVGLDAEKIAERGINVDGNESGFVSNSFLLALYYTGIFGFIAYVSMWFWAFRMAWTSPTSVRPLLVAFMFAGIFLTFTDNTIFKFEAITAWALFMVGVVAGISTLARKAGISAFAMAPAMPLPQPDVVQGSSGPVKPRGRIDLSDYYARRMTKDV